MARCGDAANGQRRVAGFPCTFSRPSFFLAFNIRGSGEFVSYEAALCLDGSFIRHLGFSWEEDATLLYKLTSPAHLQGGRESCTGLGKPWSIEGSFVIYRGFSKEEDTLLYKLTSPAHVSVYTLRGSAEFVSVCGSLVSIDGSFWFIQGKRIHLFFSNLPSPALLPRCDWLNREEASGASSTSEI